MLRIWLPQLNIVTISSTLKRYGLSVAYLFLFCIALVLSTERGLAEQILAGSVSVPQSRAEILYSFSPIVDAVAPSVVNVYAKRFVRERQRGLFDDPFFKQFFGEGFGSRLGPGAQREQESLGSGVIVDDKGLIVTNHHVIKNAEELTVILADRREFKAKVVVDDERTDLSILELVAPPDDLKAIKLRDSDDVSVGDLVLAIGNPFGVGQTVTSGIISALARTQVGIIDYQSFIQTDAAINPGNSGGALVGMDGLLIGVNTAIFSRSGGSVGIGFAIPANMVGQIIRAAQKGEDIVRPWLGVSLQRVSNELVNTLRLERPYGALVTSLHPLSPLKVAKLEVGDVILEIDNVQVDNDAALRYQIATRDVGGTVQIAIMRDGHRLVKKVKLTPAPEVPPRRQTVLANMGVLSGANVANINPALSDELRLPMDLSGLIVLSVTRNSPAARFGLRMGDIIKRVDETTISSVSDLLAMSDAFARVSSIEVLRGDRILKANIR
jgi:Do/DeqQ family serine protease